MAIFLVKFYRIISHFRFYNLLKYFLGLTWYGFRTRAGLAVHQHKTLWTLLARRMYDIQQVVLELEKIIFCTVCIKRLHEYIWTIFGWKNAKEKCNWRQKKKAMGKRFPSLSSNILITTGNILHYLIVFLLIKTRFMYIFLQFSKL